MRRIKHRYEKSGRILKLFLFVNMGFLTPTCEREIQLDLPEYERQLVVEGWIEQDRQAKILLSYSAPYFTAIDSENIRDYAATRAKITLSCGQDSEILTLKPNDIYFPPYYYFSTQLFGEINQVYELKIENDGKIYHSTTTIPEIVYPDSVWFKLEPDEDSLGLMWVRFTDNPLTNNYYRTLVKRMGKDNRYIPTFISIFDDGLFSGQAITISLSKGSGNLLEVGTSRFFQLGDTLVLKFCSIDYEHYLFWHTLQNSILTSANPFSTNEGEVISNIEGALGIWGGYAAAYDTVIAK